MLIAYMHIEKAGGTSWTSTLRKSFGLAHADVFASPKKDAFTQNDLDYTKKIYPSLKSIAGHRLKPHIGFTDDIRFYTIMREPISRAISHYQYLYDSQMAPLPDFWTWINMEENQNMMLKKIAGEESMEKAIDIIENKFFFIGYLENLNESLETLCKLSPYPINYVKPENKNAAKTNLIKKRIKENSKYMERLTELNKLDIELYQYIVNTLYPKYRNLASIREERDAGEVSKWKGIYGSLYRNLVGKPSIRLRNLSKYNTIKIDLQMVGLNDNFVGHYFPDQQIKVRNLLFGKEKDIEELI